MRRKAHGERFSLRGEWQNSRAEGQNHARKGKVCSGNAKLARGRQSSTLWVSATFEHLPPWGSCYPLLHRAEVFCAPWFSCPWVRQPLALLRPIGSPFLYSCLLGFWLPFFWFATLPLLKQLAPLFNFPPRPPPFHPALCPKKSQKLSFTALVK